MLRRYVNSTKIKKSKLLSYTLILSLYLSGSIASATEPRTVTLREGEKAPYAGQLITVNRAIKLGQLAENCKHSIEIETERLRLLFKADLFLEQGRSKLEEARRELREEAYKQRLERSWMEHPAFVAAVTVVTTYAILIGAKKLNN